MWYMVVAIPPANVCLGSKADGRFWVESGHSFAVLADPIKKSPAGSLQPSSCPKLLGLRLPSRIVSGIDVRQCKWPLRLDLQNHA